MSTLLMASESQEQAWSTAWKGLSSEVGPACVFCSASLGLCVVDSGLI